MFCTHEAHFTLTSSAKGTTEDSDVYSWTFKDGSKATVKMEERSSIEHSITYSVVTAEPALPFSSVYAKISLWPVTTGPNEGSTFITWSGQWSSDACESNVMRFTFQGRTGAHKK